MQEFLVSQSTVSEFAYGKSTFRTFRKGTKMIDISSVF